MSGSYSERKSDSTAVLETALALLSAGLSPIPIQPDSKKPLRSWKEFQERRATEKEVREWFNRSLDAKLAIVTGAISGIVVVDVDDASERPWAEATYGASPAVVRTPRGGFHLYLRHPGHPVANATRVDGRAVDVRGDGGFVVCPPSPGYSWESAR